MKATITALGVILMVLGGMLSVTLVFPGFIRVGDNYFLSFLPLGGVFMAIIGFLTFLVGVAAPATESQQQKRYPPFYKPQQPTRRQQQPQQQTTPTKETVKTVAICPKCKNRIPTTVKFCPECGEDLRPKKVS